MNLEVEREHVVQLLCQRYAQDALTTEELEARLEAAYRAKDLSELQALTRTLPVAAAGAPAIATQRQGHAPAAAQQRILSVMADVRKRGEWEPARNIRAVAVLAALELDFREARILEGVTTLDVSATLAEVRIIVPPGVHVQCDGSAILGEFQQKLDGDLPDGPDVATLRISGLAVLAEVSVVMRMPGESGMSALRRKFLRRR